MKLLNSKVLTLLLIIVSMSCKENPKSNSDNIGTSPEKTVGNEYASEQLTPGKWWPKENGLMFGEPNTEPVFSMYCDHKNGKIMLYRMGTIDTGEGRGFKLVVSTGDINGYWQSTGEAFPRLADTLSTEKRFWRQMSQTKRFVVESAGKKHMVLPVTATVKEFLENCALHADGNSRDKNPG